MVKTSDRPPPQRETKNLAAAASAAPRSTEFLIGVILAIPIASPDKTPPPPLLQRGGIKTREREGVTTETIICQIKGALSMREIGEEECRMGSRRIASMIMRRIVIWSFPKG